MPALTILSARMAAFPFSETLSFGGLVGSSCARSWTFLYVALRNVFLGRKSKNRASEDMKRVRVTHRAAPIFSGNRPVTSACVANRISDLKPVYQRRFRVVPPTEPPSYPDELAGARKETINAVVDSAFRGQPPSIASMNYLPEEHQMWRCCYHRICSGAKEHASRDFLHGLHILGYSEDSIPDLQQLDSHLHVSCGWRVAAVRGSLPPVAFFRHLANREMPCTMYIRPSSKFKFTDDPDCCHELLGHMPALFIESWSALYQRFGQKGLELEARGDSAAMDKLVLAYFAVVEKGMVKDEPGYSPKAIGASLITGTGELMYAMNNPQLLRPLCMDDVMTHGSAREDCYMPCFFVGESVAEMASAVTDWMETL